MGTLLETMDSLNPSRTNVPIAHTMAKPAVSNGNIIPRADRKLKNRMNAINKNDMGMSLIISVDIMLAT